jgi:hypothetical protein
MGQEKGWVNGGAWGAEESGTDGTGEMVSEWWWVVI